MVQGSSLEPRVLYAASPAWWLRLIGCVLAGLGVLPFVFTMAHLLQNLTTTSRWLALGLCALTIALISLALAALVRPRFVVATDGILVRGAVLSRHIPWAEVSHIEVDQRRRILGQTVVVTRSGDRIGCGITAASFAIRRGESTFDHGHDLRQPAIPTRAAIDGHQRYLRGEFDSSPQR